MFAEEAEKLGVHLVDDLAEIGGVVLKIHSVGLNDEHAAFVPAEDEILVFLIEVGQVVNLHRLLVLSSAALYLRHESGHGLTEVDHHIRHFHLPFHQVEELHESLVVPFGEVSPLVVVTDEDIDALEDRAVLDDGVRGALHRQHILEPLFEEIGLQTERPAVDIAVVILQVRIEAHGFKPRLPSVIPRQHLGQRRLPGTDISCYGYIHESNE